MDDSQSTPGPSSRRSFLRQGVAALAGMSAFVAALSPLKDMDPDDIPSLDGFLQNHYKEMSDQDMSGALQRIQDEVKKRYQADVVVRDVKPTEGVEFVYALNLSRCVGCRRCASACVEENNQSRDQDMSYIRVLEMPMGTIDIEKGNHTYDHATVPADDHFYMPIQCHHCADAPCVKVCPVGATWTEPDGLTVVDYDWCIGCRYCEAACPYWARRFNFTQPELPAEEINPDMSYLSNRPRSKGVMEKCTFCLHRTREGKMPACLEACPVGARKFGNVLDPQSSVAQILKTKRVFVLKEDVGTLPRFFYYFDERTPQHEPPAPEKLAPSRHEGEGR